jgi:hypothetical protein
MNIRRLRAEQLRDAMLLAAGELNLTTGGESVDSAQPRRSIYLKVLRNSPDGLLEAFDGADGFNSMAKRPTTTTANQALMLFNGPWLLSRAKAMKGVVEKNAADDHQFIDAAWRRLYGRPPAASEMEGSLAFLREQARRLEVQTPSAAEVAPPVASMPRREGQAAEISGKTPDARLAVPDNPSLPSGDFTVEAFVLLRSLYDDATVRVIASQWNGDNGHPGWSLGVTSKKSRYTPQNLVLQIVGKSAEGKPLYEVIPSNLRLELDKPYFVAASVKVAGTDSSEAMFYVKELAATDKPLHTARASFQVPGGYDNSASLVLGGRAGGDRSAWDGLLDDVRLSAAALPPEELLVNNTAARETTVGLWRFEEQPGFHADESGRNNRLTSLPAPASPAALTPHEAARVDFCHVLLNSNEFLYVE